MRRGAARPTVEAPVRLMRFDPAEWPNGPRGTTYQTYGPWESAFHAWHDARHAYTAEHGRQTSIGGPLTQILEEMRVKAQHWADVSEPQYRQRWVDEVQRITSTLEGRPPTGPRGRRTSGARRSGLRRTRGI